MKGIQKKLLTCLLVIYMAMTLMACGSLKDIQDAMANKDAKEEVEEEEKDKKEDEDEKEEKDEKESDDEDNGKSSKSKYPVLGQEDIADFDGYTYLYCENLRTESEQNAETGKMESSELEVFIPIDEYNYVNRNYISGNKLGIEYKVSLEPSIRYDGEDYLFSENLDYYLENMYDPFYADDYKDIVMSGAQDLDDKTALATVEYCRYDKYNDEYATIFATYYLAELDNGVQVLVEMQVNSKEVTGKTPQLIEELETFYPFEIDWDEARAAKKLEDYLATGGDNTFTTGYVMFELPAGWAEDTEVGDYENRVYAPGGDAQVAGCFISLYDEYVGYNYAKDAGILNNEQAMVDTIKAMMEASEETAEISYYGDTCLGPAVLAETTAVMENGSEVAIQVYWMFGQSDMYALTASNLTDSAEDAFAVAKDILENGQIKEY